MRVALEIEADDEQIIGVGRDSRETKILRLAAGRFANDLEPGEFQPPGIAASTAKTGDPLKRPPGTFNKGTAREAMANGHPFFWLRRYVWSRQGASEAELHAAWADRLEKLCGGDTAKETEEVEAEPVTA